MDLIAGLTAPVLQLGLLGLLAGRKLWRTGKSPLFCLYTLYSVVVIAVQLSAMNRPDHFYVLYWSTEIIYGLLALLAIGEASWPTLKTCFDGWAGLLPPLSVLLVIVNSVWRALYYPVGQGPFVHLAAGAYSLMRGIFWLEAAAFLMAAHLALRKNSPILWGRYRAGILLGFGLAALGTLSVDLARAYLGTRFELLFRYVPAGAYIGSVLIWLVTFYGKEPPTNKRLAEPELFRKAALYVTEAVDQAKKDLGVRFA